MKDEEKIMKCFPCKLYFILSVVKHPALSSRASSCVRLVIVTLAVRAI